MGSNGSKSSRSICCGRSIVKSGRKCGMVGSAPCYYSYNTKGNVPREMLNRGGMP